MTVSSSVGYALPSAAEAAKVPRIVGKGEDNTDKEMFLKLMIAQLKNQDPTAPMDQKDMMASVTQFSQVEQMENMTKAMETLSLAQGVNMVGQFVDYRHVEKNDNGTTAVDEIRTGKVISVEQADGAVKLMLANGVRVKPADVTSVSLESRPPQSMLDKYVKYSVRATNSEGVEGTTVLTGRVSSLTGTGDSTALVINGRRIDPDAVVTVSNIRYNWPESLAPGMTEVPYGTP